MHRCVYCSLDFFISTDSFCHSFRFCAARDEKRRRPWPRVHGLCGGRWVQGPRREGWRQGRCVLSHLLRRMPFLQGTGVQPVRQASHCSIPVDIVHLSGRTEFTCYVVQRMVTLLPLPIIPRICICLHFVALSWPVQPPQATSQQSLCMCAEPTTAKLWSTSMDATSVVFLDVSQHCRI